MRLLVDTHVVLWQSSGEPRLGSGAQEAIAAAEDMSFSSVSFAGIGVKVSIGKLNLPVAFRETVLSIGLRVLALSPEQGLALADLPLLHRDPFDRLLVAQALSERLTLLTADPRIRQHDVPTIDASV